MLAMVVWQYDNNCSGCREVRFAGHEYFALVPPGETITDLEIAVLLDPKILNSAP